jgi:hypothetical protein
MCSASSSSRARSTSSPDCSGNPRQTHRSRRRHADALAARIAGLCGEVLTSLVVPKAGACGARLPGWRRDAGPRACRPLKKCGRHIKVMLEPIRLRLRPRRDAPLRWVATRDTACRPAWTGSWTGSPDNPSAASAVSAMIRVICAGRTLGARGRASHNPPVVGSGRRRVRQRHGNRLDADCAPRRGCAIIPMIAIHRQEVRPMYAASVIGAPLQDTIARLR